MTKDNKDVSEPEEIQDSRTSDSISSTPHSGLPTSRDGDDVLRAFSFIANISQIHLPVTLSVGGQLIAGMLIGYNEYVKGLSAELDQFVESYRDEDKEFVAKIVKQAVREDPIDFDNAPTMYDFNFIHLRDARIFLGSQSKPIPYDKGVLWRTPIDAVDGFILGKLAYEERAIE